MNQLPDTLVKINESLAKDISPIDHARLLSAEHHFKSNPWFWIWIPHLEWTYVSEEHKIKCLKTTNGRPIDLDGIGLDYKELSYIEQTKYIRPDFWPFNYQTKQGDDNAS